MEARRQCKDIFKVLKRKKLSTNKSVSDKKCLSKIKRSAYGMTV